MLAGILGLIAALWLSCLGHRARKWMITAGIVTLALPPFLVTNCWLYYLGNTGVWRSWMPANILSIGGGIWVLSLMLWPVTCLFVAGAWRRLENALLESDLALTGWALIRHLLIPIAGRHFLLGLFLTFVLALNNFSVPAVLQIKVLPVESWIRFSTTFDTAGALAASWPCVVLPLILLIWVARRDVRWPRTARPVETRIFRRQIGPLWFRFSGICTLALCLLSIGLPLVQPMAASRSWFELPQALAAGRAAIWNSLLVATAAATAGVGLSLLLCPAVGRALRARSAHHAITGRICWASGPPWHGLVGWFLWMPYLLPGVLLGLALIFVLNRPGFTLIYEGPAIVILAFLIRYLAVSWNAVSYALGAADRDLADVARLEGATRWQMLRYVYWPQIAAQAAAAWYVVFLLCLWDVESMILVTPPGGETLALRVFNLLHYGYNAQVNALCLTLVAVAILPLLLWEFSRLAMAGVKRFARGESPAWASLLLLLLLVLGVAGCTGDSEQSRSTKLNSRLFSAVEIFGSRGAGVGQVNKPRSVATDAQDNVYVCDMTGRVQKFSSGGVFMLSWQMPETDIGKPKGMCRDREGNIVVIEPHYQRVNHFSPAGVLLRQWGASGTGPGQFKLPRAVGVNSSGEIYVSEYAAAERVQRFKLTGRAAEGVSTGAEFIDGFGKAGTKEGEFNRPEGLCVDSQDRVYVADSCNHRIQVFSREGKFLRAYGKAGAGLGELSYPYDICVDPTGTQFVCEFGNSRIQVFDAQDRPIEIIGRPGASPGQFSNPWGLALDSAGNLYVADSLNHRVQKLIRKNPLSHEHLSVTGHSGGEEGTRPGTLN